ncbi:gamma-glutamyltranspeptidase / glutathione hydrolase [Chitinophaga terrae (ex Kim and Jung 2007)]|uniref:Glutathione hydrolase proenzyme n=1 Tax=Chitinophaga terrae (ex Kim and Jung 2007) TaxID=408074 RepID=A0A1H3YPP3_9BACT|nr:gamma-glutamyltransferase [Chitinophaga terrae (ex Kim and Jung 2007)]GEP88412.1 gamma-glutamyltransferase [Chitinophaga terrae (ex Kim and Jung 2007)]SEA13004.1 gamma-glutamyltranspeptidase / glutathione hydrolase [Chitinophaga terrae (ex Kim and Jung 2007)]
MRFLLTIGVVICTAYTTYAQRTIDPYHYSIEKNIRVAKGAVVSAHPLASEVGAMILEQGGNAVDAAIATQLALAVVYPGAGNIGGGGFLVGHLKNGKNIAIDYREKAPAKASRNMYLDSAGNAITQLSLDGHLAAGVPGTVAGLFASMKYARLPFKKLIAPAIELAAKGYVITAAEARDLNEAKEQFIRLNTAPTAFVREEPWKAGDTLFQPELAHTLALIRDKGAAGFYQGETAANIVAEMKRGNGIITLADLKNYQAKERQAVAFPYKKYTIVTMPLPSSGGICLQQLMGMVENYPIAKWGFHSPEAVQLMIEAERRAYADRANFLGDPDFVKVPVKRLTDKKYLASRMQDFVPGKAGSSEITKAGVFPESEETTHLSIIDAEGNAIAVTTTLNGHYGSRTVVGGSGFLLNNEMDDFSVKPGVPNMYGLVGNEANAIAPHKRMLSSMTPTLVLEKNQVLYSLGTPGGSTIITSVFQTLMNTLEFGLTAEEAINKPKFHHQWLPDQVMVENDFPESTIRALEQMGYKITKRGAIGRSEIIKRDPKTKQLEASGDHRGDDSAAGY